MESFHRFVGLLFVLFVLHSGSGIGQTLSPNPSAQIRPDADTKAAGTSSKDKIKRWFEFDQLSAATRYHFIENDNNNKAANNVQYQFAAKFRFKFDAKGKYSVAATLATGPSFTTSWNASGWGTGKTQKNLNFKQLYFNAKPAKAVEFQIGGLYVNYGESTEVTTYDNDGYIVGERVQIRFPQKLYFDEISVTHGRLADPVMPNVFNRFKRFGKQNYHQFLVRKQINKWVGFSADYTFESGIDTFHQAVKFKLPKTQIIDTLIFENYERTDPDRNYGFNIFGEKKLNKIFTLSGGFANIHIKALNADRFPPGKRIYFSAIAKLTPEFSVTTQFTQGVGFIAPTIARTRLDIAFNYNILETLRRSKYF
ncbi:MAG: hypothetical protein ABIO36_10255 [Pyrinomonadaceae bacterium]